MIEKSMLKDGENKNLTHLKTQKGLTLIALVITIIVMVILAGVSLSLTTGDNGVLNKAKLAKEETRAGQVKDVLDVWFADKQIADEIGLKSEHIDKVIERLKNDGLLTESEINEINDPNNVNKEIKIGNQIISFNYNSNDTESDSTIYDKDTQETLKYLTITANGEVNIKEAGLYYNSDTRAFTGKDFPLEKIVIPEKINGITVTSLGENFFIAKGVQILKLPKENISIVGMNDERINRFGGTSHLHELYLYNNTEKNIGTFVNYIKGRYTQCGIINVDKFLTYFTVTTDGEVNINKNIYDSFYNSYYGSYYNSYYGSYYNSYYDSYYGSYYDSYYGSYYDSYYGSYYDPYYDSYYGSYYNSYYGSYYDPYYGSYYGTSGSIEVPIKELAIPSEINGITVTSLGEEFICGRGVEKLILPKTITQIKASESLLKRGCPDLTSVVTYQPRAVGNYFLNIVGAGGITILYDDGYVSM